MKPLHAGLLVVGAVLAGALAIKMTQPPPIPAAPAPVAVARNPVVPAVPAATLPAKPATVKPTVKVSPIPDAIAPAPPPVYLAEPARPVIRKNKPILLAKASPERELPEKTLPDVPSPLLLPPVPYEPPPAPAADPSPQVSLPAVPPPAAPAPPRQVTLRTGTTIQIRLDESVSSDHSVAGGTFNASLAEPLVVDGLVIAERGAHVTGRIVDTQKAGRFTGTSSIELQLTSLVSSDGQKIGISTDPWTKQGETSHGENGAKIGGGAALGAIIGAIAGGGAGAAIGAGIGGGAGAATVAATRPKPVNVPSETVIRFRLATKITISERQL